MGFEYGVLLGDQSQLEGDGNQVRYVSICSLEEQLQRSARETVEHLQQNPALIRSLTRHLAVASDIGKAGVDILPSPSRTSTRARCTAVSTAR